MYRENKNFGFGDLAIGNKGKNDFLTSVNTLLDWDSIEKILKSSLKRGPVRKMRIYNVKHCFLLYLLNSSYFYTILSQFALHYANRVYSIDTRNQTLKIKGLQRLTRLVSIRRIKNEKNWIHSS